MDSLERAGIEPFVQGPGVALLSWHDPKSAVSVAFDETLRRSSRTNADARFGRVALTGARELASEWGVAGIPALMVYRDGILVFSQAGPLPAQVLDALVQAVWSLDMDEVRKGVNGQGARMFLSFHPERSPPFEVIGSDDDSGGAAGHRGP